MLLAGDVGGTKTLIGLFDRGTRRPTPREARSFRTLDFADLASLAHEFLRAVGVAASDIESACFGVAGPVKDGRARLTNVPWTIEAAAVSRRLPVPRTELINDLEALAWAVPVLETSELEELWKGDIDREGGAALIAAGTGLGIALLPKVNGRFVPLASEGGHADFPARTDDEVKLLKMLLREFGRAELEHVLSGPGLANIRRLVYPHTCTTLASSADAEDVPALISKAALEDRCGECRKTLELFVSVYGAAAGNLALTALATGGLFVGGGIAPRILEALRWPVFLDSFRAKSPLDNLMRRIPVNVILNPAAGLLGAAVFASK